VWEIPGLAADAAPRTFNRVGIVGRGGCQERSSGYFARMHPYADYGTVSIGYIGGASAVDSPSVKTHR
jgi:hypothetical protein